MPAYNFLQIKYIRHYAKHLGIDCEEAARRWIEFGLAAKYALLYKEHYYLFAQELVPCPSTELTQSR
jgi:hypothetical protein